MSVVSERRGGRDGEGRTEVADRCGGGRPGPRIDRLFAVFTIPRRADGAAAGGSPVTLLSSLLSLGSGSGVVLSTVALLDSSPT